jgi:hydroxymethylpyrimidine/phosphomethylpyrimidine kinase
MSGRTADPQSLPCALTVASSDSGGGAGIQADLKTMARFGVYGASVLVSTTAQNTTGVRDVHVLPTDHVRAQFDAVTEDGDVGAVKTGMLATAEGVRTVASCLDDYDGPVVVDPVMVATSGDRLLEREAVEAYTDLLGHAALVTPNADETEELTGEWPDSAAARERAATQFFEWGADAVLFKGGHVECGVSGESDGDDGGGVVRDHLVTPDDEWTFEGPRVEGASTHGSGCTLSSAIAAGLARGDPLERAVERGIAFVRAAIERPAAVGERGSVNHLVGGDWR